MTARVARQKGFSLLEILVVAAGVAIVAGVSFPMVATVLQRARAAGAGDVLALTIRDARARAMATGWQYRVVAFDGSGAVPNAFRIEGMNPATGGTWPAATATSPPVAYGVNQMYEAYTTLPAEFPGAAIEVPLGGPSFIVTFDSRGQQATACVPVACQVRIATPSRTATVTVSQGGAVQVAK